MITFYGKFVRPANNHLIRGSSSGELDNFNVCEYYLKQKYKKNSYGNNFSKCLYNNPYYFKHVELFRPILNPLFARSKNHLLAILLDIDQVSLNKVLAYQKYIIIQDYEGRFDPGTIISYLDFRRIKEIGC